MKWFDSYLSHRKQIVQVESKFSLPEELVEHGVPQGSILGPLIFIIFNNDFPDNSEGGQSILYADDDTVNVSDEDPIRLKSKIQKLTCPLSGLQIIGWYVQVKKQNCS